MPGTIVVEYCSTVFCSKHNLISACSDVSCTSGHLEIHNN